MTTRITTYGPPNQTRGPSPRSTTSDAALALAGAAATPPATSDETSAMAHGRSDATAAAATNPNTLATMT